MTKPWLDIIGIGADGLKSLSPAKQKLVDNAEIIITAKRIEQFLTEVKAEIHIWPVPFDAMIDEVHAWKGKKILVIATGDPMWHGVGSTISRHLDPGEYTVNPAPPAFSLAAARLGWPLSTVETLTLHGYSRPTSLIKPFIQPGSKLITLTGGNETVHKVAAHLVEMGFGQSIMHVLEDMDEPSENYIKFTARQIPDIEFSGFNTLGIECIAHITADIFPRIPGLPDHAYEHDGQLTKQNVRAITLSALAPSPGQLLWDIGAGSGSIAIEWMRTHLSNRAIAFESNPERIELIKTNAENLGTPYLNVIEGKFPASTRHSGEGRNPFREPDTKNKVHGMDTGDKHRYDDSLADKPDAIFIGGGITEPEMFETAWAALKSGGVIVVNCVTIESRHKLLEVHEKTGGELTEIAISTLQSLGSKLALKPALPVLQYKAYKP